MWTVVSTWLSLARVKKRLSLNSRRIGGLLKGRGYGTI